MAKNKNQNRSNRTWKKNSYDTSLYHAGLMSFKRPCMRKIPIETLEENETQHILDPLWEIKGESRNHQFEVTNKVLGESFQDLKPNFPDEQLAEIAQRQTIRFRDWLGAEQVKELLLETRSKLQIGTGIASIFETHLQMHHVYGVPWIPASSVKGAVRSWVIAKYFQASEKKALKDSGFSFLFGTHESKHGLAAVAFGDAFPTQGLKMEMDIINVHQMKYYDGKGLPIDSAQPNLVNFLVLKPACQFSFSVGMLGKGAVKGSLAKHHPSKEPLDLVAHLLVEALANWGVGAKTSLGMGRFIKIDKTQQHDVDS